MNKMDKLKMSKGIMDTKLGNCLLVMISLSVGIS